MWFRLASANWTNTGNLGTMDSISGSWTVTCSTSGGIVKTTGDGMVTKGGTWTGTFTLSDGATFTSATLTPSSAGTVSTSTSGTTVTITIASVSNNCTLAVVATGGGGNEGNTPAYPESLNDTAWEDMTYYDLFITNNRAPAINNNSMTNAFGNITYTDIAGSTTIKSDDTVADNYVPPYSLYVSGTSSQQAKSNKNYANTTSYFLAANVKVTNYTKGYCGVIFGSNFDACASAVTDGYEVFSAIGDNSDSSTSTVTALYIGSASSANLTGYINNPVIIDMSIFTTAPSLEELTTLYKNYTAKLIAG